MALPILPARTRDRAVPIEYDSRRAALFTPERQETLFQRGQTYSPLQLAVEGARLAYYRAEKSESEKTRLSEALARVDFGALTLFQDAKTGTEAFAARRRDGATLLSFRGTQPDDVTDLATDLRAQRWRGVNPPAASTRGSPRQAAHCCRRFRSGQRPRASTPAR